MQLSTWARRLFCATLALTLLTISGTAIQKPNAKKRNPNKPAFTSPVVTKKTPNHSVDIDVDITDAKQLHLVVRDGGNGYGCDWADWAQPRLVGPKGELKLTSLKWKTAKSDWGKTSVNKNAAGRALRIAGKPVEYGIGTHANSLITYDLPKGYTHFKARGGLDNGGTDQPGGNATSVQFMVFLNTVPPRFTRTINANAGPGSGLDPADALAALDVADGLEVTLFANEPMLLSPTNIDIDSRGRVWVCEVVNYRRNNGRRKEGDRILILEDTDGDGKADSKKVFYQGRDIDSAHGICVLETPNDKKKEVIISIGQYVYVFNDENGDDVADGKRILFSGISGTQHDHGIHAFIFGPDGKFYFNFGNAGKQIRDAKGKPIVDLAGNVINDQRKPYQEGMAFRCNPDGTEMETLGWNFRNNWEVTVDSFGSLWQSDNDDDGNRGVRINYVIEFGNYGYKDELTGAAWRSPRTGMSPQVPLRHWHLNDPGVMPNLLQTGQGSPTGILVYEGDLLPKVFHNQVIHCDAGPNIVRAYPVEKDGAGYKAKIVDVLKGTRDKWFRPSDVCVAPDGSLIIADWYDPGVGGHNMRDLERGRIFRVAPPKSPYKIPKYDYTTAEGAIQALKSPTLSIRYLAWQALFGMKDKAVPALEKVFKSDDNPRFRARALWLLGKMKGKSYVDVAVKDEDPNIRIVGLRLARQLKLNVLDYVEKLINDKSPAVRRECAVALADRPTKDVSDLWAQLAVQHDGEDRWYLEALGIAGRKSWDACFDAWMRKVGEKWNTASGRDIIWRSRASSTPKYLARIISDESTSVKELPRYFRAFDFLSGQEKSDALLQLAFTEPAGPAERANFIRTESLKRMKGFNASNPQQREALNRVLDNAKGTSQFVDLVERFNVKERYPELLGIAQKNATAQLGMDAMSVLLAKKQDGLITKALGDKDATKASATAQALVMTKDPKAGEMLMPFIANNKTDLQLRRLAVSAVGQSPKGVNYLLTLAKSEKLDPQLKDAVAATLHQNASPAMKAEVAKLFPLPASKNKEPLPGIDQLLKMQGDVMRGQKIFATTATCAACHKVSNVGKEVGPDLSLIGDKLSREAMFESILFPSAGISHNYETYEVRLKRGTVVQGVLVSQTPEEVSIKDKDAIVRTYKRSTIEILKKQPTSLMPADLTKVMTKQDLLDVVSYLQTLKKK